MELTQVYAQTVTELYTEIFYNVPPEELSTIAFKAVTTPERDSFKAGYLLQFIRTISNQDIVLSESFLLPINKIFAPRLLPTLEFSHFLFSPVPWIPEIELIVYKTDMPIFFESFAVAATSTATQTINVTTTPQELIPANASRKGLTIRNPTSRIISVGFSNSLSTTNYYVNIAANAVYEFQPNYTGGIWFVSTSAAQISYTEFS